MMNNNNSTSTCTCLTKSKIRNFLIDHNVSAKNQLSYRPPIPKLFRNKARIFDKEKQP